MIFIPEKLKRKILADKYNTIIFGMGKGRELYLVGGYMRDILRGIKSQDRDYVLSGDLRSFVREIRNSIGGTLVQFKSDDTMRIGFKEGLTFDFSTLKGTLKDDLSKRDFTINAIAWSPERGIVDIHQGVNDIKDKRIRAVSRKNLISDPLRILRAYRFAAEMNGSIEKKTHGILKTLHKKIKRVSFERITLELFHLLNCKKAVKYLEIALADGILTDILSIPYRVLEKNIRAIYKLEKAVLQVLPHIFKVKLYRTFSQNLTYKGLLCLEVLMRNDINQYKEIHRIKLSNMIRKRIDLAHKSLELFNKKRVISESSLFSIFYESKEAAIDAIIIKNRLDLFDDYKRFQRIMKYGFLSSEEIMNISGIQKGPGIGDMIKELKKTQYEKKVKSKKQAVQFIKEWSNLKEDNII
jgi:tRNA nucleotidyltransferase/poly(A) polymerase